MAIMKKRGVLCAAGGDANEYLLHFLCLLLTFARESAIVCDQGV